MTLNDHRKPPKRVWLQWYGFSTGGGEWRPVLTPCYGYLTVGPYEAMEHKSDAPR